MDGKSIQALEIEIADLGKKLANKIRQLVEMQNALIENQENKLNTSISKISKYSPSETKIALFRSLFRGREDLYAKRFESKKTGKSGYQPVCRNEWVRDICEKPKISCGSCAKRSFEPINDDVIKYHLEGFYPAKNEFGQKSPFVMGIYPLLQNETCYFLAIDFDKKTWREDALAFMATCKIEGIPAALERSRSGNGAHVWVFFEKPVLAVKARKLGSFLMTRTLDQRPEIGLDSFDRFFPNQDTLPKGGFGNLIALPLQKTAREQNHSIFLDDNMIPYTDQWAFLASIERIDESKMDMLIQTAVNRNELLPVVYDPLETEDEIKPWQKKSAVLPVISEPIPQKIELVLADQLYVNHTGLPPVLRNRILRLASFANPEFYRAQKMRLPTWNKPHILCCYEFFPEYIGLPLGCLDGLMSILEHYKIKPVLTDKQNHGQHIDIQFLGELREDQKKAAKKLMESPMGILSASTAFGKTVLALWMIAERKVNTVILVHRKLLADQWAERINQFLGIPKKDIGYYSGTKKKRTGIIDIVVMQSIVKKDVSNNLSVVDWISDYGQIIVDECHHVSAASFERIIRKSPAHYRLGLSATIVRRDGQHPIVLMNLGGIRYSDSNVKHAQAFAHKVFPRYTDFSFPDELRASKKLGNTSQIINTIFQCVINDDARNKLIIQDIVTMFNEGRECLVLTDRLEHLDILEDALKNQISSIFILKGKLGKKKYKAVMEGIVNTPSHKNKLILATGSFLGEGFDLPSLDTLFLVFPFSWKGKLVQYTGRLSRVFHGKKEIRVYDYVDDKVPELAGMYGKRLKGYKSLGFIVE